MRPRAWRDALAVFLRAALALLCLITAVTAATAGAAEGYSFSVVPQFEPRKLYAIWRPILDELSRRTGLELRLQTTLSIPEFEEGLASGRFDFVFANPYHVWRERARAGYVPLVRDGVPLKGLVLVPRDSPLRTVEELDGKTLAVPSPNAFAASLLVRADLLRHHGVRVVMLNAQTHSSSYLHAVTGQAVACGGIDKTFAEQPTEVRGALRILFETRPYPSHPVAAHPRVPVDVRRRVEKAFLALAGTPEGDALLDRVPMSRPVVARIEDYEPFAALKLEEFWVEGR